MKIDIRREPPVDIFRNRGKYSRIFIALLALVVCGMLVIAYAVLAELQYNEKLESLALAFYVGAGVAIFYYGEKLQAYKKLTPAQEVELADLGRKHSAIGIYCSLVAKSGRKPIWAEYEACQNLAEELNREATPEEPKYGPGG